jgi:prevent-host-death family protein
MKTLSLSEAKMKLSALIDEIGATDEEVVITKNGLRAAVLVSPDEYDSWRETMAIRFDRNSMEEIREGLAALKEGRASLYTLEELFEDWTARVAASVVLQLRIPDDVARLIRTLHPAIKKKVRAALETIVSAPGTGKALKEELAGLRSYRIGKLRIVYRLVGDERVEVVAIGPRRYIYEETYRKLQGEEG